MIVSRILGQEYSMLATKAIGISEILMALWVVSKIRPRWCAVTQIAVVATMNIIEFVAAPDLLLFGRANAIVATIFIVIIFLNEFVLTKPAITSINNFQT